MFLLSTAESRLKDKKCVIIHIIHLEIKNHKYLALSRTIFIFCKKLLNVSWRIC